MNRNMLGMMMDRALCTTWALLGLGMIVTAGCSEVPGDSVQAESTVQAENAVPESAAPAMPGPVLDGVSKSLVIVGYSTSYAWPAMLQEMLDQHSAGERVYHLLNAVIGGSPVGRWIAPAESDDYQATYGAMRRDFFGADSALRGDVPEPTVAIVQQSLQRTPTPDTRLGPVTSAVDDEGIEIGADALGQLVTQLRADGIERIYIGMHIYKQGYEPEVGNERFALARLLDRGHTFVFAGPDVWSSTIAEHPEAFTEDGLHPNERGAKIMAEGWYRALAGSEAREEIVSMLQERAYDINQMTGAYLAWRRGDDAPQ
jgi:hypothetical protein